MLQLRSGRLVNISLFFFFLRFEEDNGQISLVLNLYLPVENIYRRFSESLSKKLLKKGGDSQFDARSFR